MIYLLSEETDIVTDNVERWFLDKNVNYKRINDINFYNLSLDFNTNFIKDATLVWHRRGKYNFLPNNIFHVYSNREPFIKYIVKEIEIMDYYIENILKKRLKGNLHWFFY